MGLFGTYIYICIYIYIYMCVCIYTYIVIEGNIGLERDALYGDM